MNTHFNVSDQELAAATGGLGPRPNDATPMINVIAAGVGTLIVTGIAIAHMNNFGPQPLRPRLLPTRSPDRD